MVTITTFALLTFLLPVADAIVDFQPPELISVDGRLEVTLDIGLVDSLVGIPWSETGVRTGPGYNGQPVGPTLRLKPGDTLVVTLNNNLEPSPALDHELAAYVKDPTNDEANVTTIYNRLTEIGNIYNPTYGYWGLNFCNLHLHGLQLPPSVEQLHDFIDGGESMTIEYTIPEDKEPGLYWYHDHVHGKAAYSYMSSLFGLIVVEGTDTDITAAPGVVGAREILMILSEGLVSPDGSVPPFFPIAAAFNWTGVTNGYMGTDTEYAVTQGETVLFRAASATVEPTLRMSIPGVTFVVLANDGLVLPEPFETDVVILPGGSRVEFLARFDTPGTYVMTRAPWAAFQSLEACTAGGFPFYPCISYDVEQEIATITVTENAPYEAPTEALVDTVELPPVAPRLQALAQQESVGDRTVLVQQQVGFPLFQIPYDGPFVPPGVGFGMDDRFYSPHYIGGTVESGSCETWTVVSDPPFFEHPFHVHGTHFMVKAIDDVPVETPFWRDTMMIPSFNITIHVCFDRMPPDETFLVHCHMPSHLDIGNGINFQSVAGPTPDPTMAPTNSPVHTGTTDPVPPTDSPSEAPPTSGVGEPTLCVRMTGIAAIVISFLMGLL